MSEYQYYEFQTVDRLLTPKEQEKIRKLSSRVQLTSSRAVFLYNYSDFSGDSGQILAKYFDAMLYIANWGTWQLMFRLPKAAVDPQWFRPYHLPDVVTVSTNAKYVILDIEINEEEGMGWVEGEGWLSQLLPLRDDLMAGDLRLLYLVWLRVAPALAGYDLDDDPMEPPLPPNLGQLSPPLKSFMDLVELDPDLVTAAAQASSRVKATTPSSLEDHLSALSAKEKHEFLLKLVRREAHVDLQLINRLQEIAGTPQSPFASTPGCRRWSELDAIAQEIENIRTKKEKQAARKKRIKELEALAPKTAQTWERVRELITLKQAKPYDEATALLQDLCDLAKYQDQLPAFISHFEQLKSDYSSRPALMKRFRKIKP